MEGPLHNSEAYFSGPNKIPHIILREMKIYTKTGDEGSTSLVGGRRISKSHLRLECYGTVDELNSVIGCARSLKPTKEVDDLLENFQNELFNAGSRLACTEAKLLETLPQVAATSIEQMEKSMDKWTAVLPALRNFILPGGHPIAAQLHLARTVCRRAERLIVRLKEDGESVDALSIKYFNRLSDTLFVLARYVNHLNKVEDVLWSSKKST